MRIFFAQAAVAATLCSAVLVARADAVDTLRGFVRDVKSGRAAFTQTVITPDGAKKKQQTGSFEFARPNRFRFAYDKPYEQLIVGDGRRVWLYDPDLNQVTARAMDQALGATPAALLAGAELERDFTLKALPAEQGLDWAQATPKAKDGTIQSLKVGFRAGTLAAVEIIDAFGQRSLLQFKDFVANAAVPAERYTFTPPAGADVIEQ